MKRDALEQSWSVMVRMESGLREFGDEIEGNNLEWVCLGLGKYRC